MFVCVCVWVCETYVVLHLNGTGLHCAPPTCVVHHGIYTHTDAFIKLILSILAIRSAYSPYTHLDLVV